MAANRTTQAALTIALSLFVMLTFALAVTTYLFFNKRQEADQAQQAATTSAAQAQAEMQATKDEMATLRGIIGVAADAPIADVETGLAKLFEGDFQGFAGDEKSYLKLIEWLRAEFRAKSDAVKKAEAEKMAAAAKAAGDVKTAEESLAAAKAAEAKAKADLDAATKQFADNRGQHETQQSKLLDEKRSEEEKARDLENLKLQIAAVGEYLPPTKQVGLAEKKPEEQLEVIRNELRNQSKAIARLNELLSAARIADPELQQIVADMRPAGDRIDGFDGRVASVDPRSGTALVSCRSTLGIRPGLVLHVFPPGDQRPQFGDRKAVLEVTQVEGPNLVRAAIRQEDARNPILAGDGVSSSLWTPGVAPAIVIVGFADIDADGRSDAKTLTDLVTKAGGRVVKEVGTDTALVVDLGMPPPAADGSQDPDFAAETKRRDRELKTANLYGTRKGSLDTLLDMLGLDADSFTEARLPRSQSVGRFPARR
jgi:chemotaxis protein histidine kinase CheA